ncbi:hypothetical protein [Arachnia propionica]|uniref:Uncharacterized protein n=1 Tax=Arachnia propionica TaxID=1750 RepID=A0A3P1WRP6_9ACTN|nr:hypothetical protein [Arachnia propionica]RRD49292.1 hypothetical protein EII35_08985 [Arachnia propionica]
MIVVLVLIGVALLAVGALVVHAVGLRAKVEDLAEECRVLRSRADELRDLTVRLNLPRGRDK